MWSVAFFPDNKTLLTGGTDRMIRRWIAVTGEPIGAVIAGSPDDPLAAYARRSRRAGVPRLRRLPHARRRGGRARGADACRASSAAGSRRAGLQLLRGAAEACDIVWTPETVSKLFEVGPMAYTPGTKMPEQKLGDRDRAALVKFLEKATQ